ncbi:histamine N-methyltransferase-like [Thalassophryne amazonica]|uniref:histamine N-methyltransferase-like n=1 Tax=Thalassophryne amazonica TaxID=390379 RepID=UPI00147209C2|nr:histamine N-methyltransferase-like [Thalassophryne amazonica]
MASQLMSLCDDDSRYQKSFSYYLEYSREHESVCSFIHNILPDLLASIGEGKSHLNVIGVGSGAGVLDLEMLSEIHQKFPDVTVDNEVVEPSSQEIEKYKALVSQKPGLDHIKFTWNTMTASEFEELWKEKKVTKKADFIHMIQMLYYVKDPESTITFFQSLLEKNGKLLLILVSGEGGWEKLWRTYYDELCKSDISQWVTSRHIKNFLDSKGQSYQSYDLPSEIDITECFSEGDEKGERLLDCLTEVVDFSKTASPELKSGVLALLQHPDCSTESDGRIIFNSSMEVLIIDPLRAS